MINKDENVYRFVLSAIRGKLLERERKKERQKEKKTERKNHSERDRAREIESKCKLKNLWSNQYVCRFVIVVLNVVFKSNC